MQQIGKDLDEPTLAESKWVLGGRVHPDYASDIRKIFYRGFNPDTKTHRATKYAELQSRVTGPRAGQADWYLCPGYGRQDPHVVNRTDPRHRFALDHGESVVSHWNRAGRFGGQTDRETYLSTTLNLEGLCTSCNGRKSAREEAGGKNVQFIQEVGPAFRGPDGT